MNRIARVFGSFGKALSYLKFGKPAVPLLLYFFLQLSLIALYVWSGSRSAGFWALIGRGIDPEIISHYPEHLLLMGNILGRLDIPLEILVLVLAQGATVLLVAAAAKRSKAGVGESFAAAGRKYIHLIIAAAASSIVVLAGFRVTLSLVGRIAGAPRGFAESTSALICILFQAFLLYPIPFILIEGRSALDALRRSVGFAGRHFIESFFLALVPFLLTVPTLVLSLSSRTIVLRISPEFLIQVQIAGEVMQFVATYLLVAGLTIFFIETRNAGEEQ